MQLKTILNRVHPCPGFVYREALLLVVAKVLTLHVMVVPDRPFFAEVTCQAASNQVVSGVLVLSRIVPAVADPW